MALTVKRFSGFRLLGLTGFVISVGLTSLGWGATVVRDEPLWSQRLRFDSPQPPILADIDGDLAQEIIIAGLNGDLVAIQGETGRVIWRRTPEAGDRRYLFVAAGVVALDDSFDLFVANESGELLWIDGSSGDMLGSVRMPGKAAAFPLVYDLDGDGRDEILVVTEANGGTLCLVRMHETRGELEIWRQIPRAAAGGETPAVGDLDGDGSPEIGVAEGTTRVAIYNAQGFAVGQWSCPAINGFITMVDVDGGGLELVFGHRNGHISLVSSRRNSEGDIDLQLAGRPLLSGNNSDFTLINTLSRTSMSESVLFLTTGLTQLAIVPETWRQLWVLGLAEAVPDTRTVVASLGEGAAVSVHVDAEGQVVVRDSLDGHVQESLRSRLRSAGVRTAPLVADFDGDGKLEIFVLCLEGSEGIAMVWATDIRAAANAALCVTPVNSPSLPGHWTPEQRSRLETQMGRFHSRVEQAALLAESALESENLEEARTQAQRVLRWDTSHPAALEIIAELDRPAEQRRMAAMAAAALVLVAVLSFFMMRWRGRRGRATELERAIQGGDWAEVIKLLQSEVQRDPSNVELKHRLAEAHVALGRFNTTSKPMIAELAKAKPTAENLWALAQCHLAEGDDSDEAIALCEDLIRRGRSEPELHRAVAQAMTSRGDASKALTHLTVIYEQNPEDTGVMRALVDAHLKANRLDAAFLKAGLAQVKRGRSDAALCSALCQAALEHGNLEDPTVEAATQIALNANADDPWALVCRGMMLINQDAWEQLPALIARLPSEGPAAEKALPLRAMMAAERGGAADDEVLRRLCHVTTVPDPRIVRRIAVRLASSSRRDELVRAYGEMALTQTDCPREVLEALAECLGNAGQKAEQAQVLGRLALMDPERPGVWDRFGLMCVELHRTDSEAAEAYRRMLDNPPKDSETLKRYLTTCGSAGVRDPRISDLGDSLLRDHPDDFDLNLLMVRLLLEQGAAADAHRCGSALISRIPEGDLEAVELLARAAFEAKDFEAAVPLYKRLNEAQSESGVWRKYLAVCLSRQGSHDEKSLTLYRQVAEAEPNDAVAQMILARGLLQSGDINAGISHVRGVLRNQPDLAPQITRLLTRVIPGLPPEATDPIRILLADLLSEQGEFSEAASHINEVTDLGSDDTKQLTLKIERLAGQTPHSADALQALGLLLIRRGEVQRAREVLEQATQIEPDSTDIEELLVACEEKLVAENDTAENRLRLGERCLRAGRHDQALTVLQPIQDDVFLFRPVRLALTRAYLEKGLTELAWQSLQQISLDANSKPLFYDLGERLRATGQMDLARDVWRQLYSSDIGFKDIRNRYELLVEEIRAQEAGEAPPSKETITDIGDKLFRERFDLEVEVGAGGMGRVYRARDITLGETVALKILPPDLANRADVVERLKSEVRLARQLTHPNIIRIHDFGALGEMRFISMEFIEGPTLKRVVRGKEVVPGDRKISFAKQMAEALAYAHRQGVIHRDIKPANILIAKGDVVKVTDFGIAKIITGSRSAVSSTHQIVGTPLYMAPEQIRGESVDGRADIYSYGVTLFEMFMGAPPFTEGDLSYKHLTEPAPMVERVSPRLQRLVEKCLRKGPEDRWQKFEELSDALASMDGGDVDFSRGL